jgi:hypothetical protein
MLMKKNQRYEIEQFLKRLNAFRRHPDIQGIAWMSTPSYSPSSDTVGRLTTDWFRPHEFLGLQNQRSLVLNVLGEAVN